MHTRHAVIDTTLGQITLVASGDAIVGLYFPHHWYMPAQEALGIRVSTADDPLLTEAERQLGEYLDGTRTVFELPTSLPATSFYERVWALLLELPYGTTTTYGELAEQLGDKTQAQAVGQAVGHNPISIIVPCHRVVGSTGKLTGYAGGLQRKKHLLNLEEPAVVKAGKLF
jgi:methylated-DNA-[protein]-cysteine S-methyltransferase